MSELDLMHLLWSIATLMSCLSTMGCLWLYKSFAKSLDTAMNIMHDMILHQSRREYGLDIPEADEVTEMSSKVNPN